MFFRSSPKISILITRDHLYVILKYLMNVVFTCWFIGNYIAHQSTIHMDAIWLQPINLCVSTFNCNPFFNSYPSPYALFPISLKKNTLAEVIDSDSATKRVMFRHAPGTCSGTGIAGEKCDMFCENQFYFHWDEACFSQRGSHIFPWLTN